MLWHSWLAETFVVWWTNGSEQRKLRLLSTRETLQASLALNCRIFLTLSLNHERSPTKIRRKLHDRVGKEVMWVEDEMFCFFKPFLNKKNYKNVQLTNLKYFVAPFYGNVSSNFLLLVIFLLSFEEKSQAKLEKLWIRFTF